MHIVKLLGVVFLALYLIVVGLHGVGVALGFVPAAVVGFFALVAGVLLLVCCVKCCCCRDGTCDKVDKP